MKLKRVCLVLFIAIIAVQFINPETSKNQGAEFQNQSNLMDSIPARLDIDADSAILMNFQSGEIMLEQNADQPFPAASMSKIMVEYLVLKAINQDKLAWGSRVQISSYAYYISSHPGFAGVPLKKSRTYTVRELYDAMAIASANGATIALAEKIAGSEKQFVEIMNQTAEDMGLDQTEFVNSTGLNNKDLGQYYSIGSPTDTNVMSASDLAVLARNLIQTFPEALHTSEEAVAVLNPVGDATNRYQYYNTNWMLPESRQAFSYPGVDGLKTGYTKEAGYCFTGTVKQGNRRFISVVMGTPTKQARFEATEKLYDYGFEKVAN